MRILILSPVGTIGGAELVLLDTIASLQSVLPNGSSFHMICPAAGPLIDAAEKLGVTTEIVALPQRMQSLGESGLRGAGKVAKMVSLGTRLAAASPGIVQYVRNLRRAAVSAKADVIHSNGLKMHLFSRLLPRRAGPVVWHVHDLLAGRPLMAGNLRYAAGHLAGAVAVSQAVAADLKEVLPNSRIFTVLNGIDTDRFRPASDSAADRANLDALAGMPAAPPETIRVGLIAAYARWKGQDVFLNAISQLGNIAGGLANVRFYIVGGTIYNTTGSQFSRIELQQTAVKLGLSNTVGFIDFQLDPAPLYQAMDVVCHTSSKPEPFGRTIVEGMASGCAVIVSAAGGAAELFTDGVDAIGTIPGDVEMLARQIRRLVVDAPLRAKLGAAARQTAVSKFDRKRLGSEMLAVYREVIDGPN